MTSMTKEQFTNWNNSWNLILEPKITMEKKSNCVQICTNVANDLSIDNNILEDLELDAIFSEMENKKQTMTKEINTFQENANSNKDFEDTSKNLSNTDFENLNFSITEDINDSINLLKSKLFTDNCNIPNKKRNVNPEKSFKLPYKYSFYGLSDTVKQLIKKYKGIEKLYDWQHECLSMKAVQERKNLIYALPTSGGKTLVAEILMLKEITCYKKNAIFVLPFVALVQEKIQSMTPFALDLNFLVEEYAAEKGHYPPRKRRKKNSVYICTIEKAQTIINCLIELDRLNEIGIIVIDELHLLGENGGRGATLECLLTKVMHLKTKIQIVGMSATIGNLDEISSFLNAELYVQNFRPVHIKEYVKCENEIWLINCKEEQIFTDKKAINYKYSKQALELDPDCLGGLVMDIAPKDSCLIFCSSRKNCENVAMLLTQVLFKSLLAYRAEEKNKLLEALKNEGGKLCPVLKKTIKFGVAYHHSGLTAEERRLLEESFKSGILCVLCCTSTLAAGVNLPARRVILRSPYIGAQFLNISRYKQMVGRAGRAGMGDIGESILICAKKDIANVQELLTSKMDKSTSSLHTEVDRGINSLIISSVFLSIAKTRLDIHKIVSSTLLKIQEKRLNINVKDITDKALTTLLKSGIFKVKSEKGIDNSKNLDTTVIFPTQISSLNEIDASSSIEKKNKKKVILVNNTELELCPLGRAALKGSIDLYSAHILYKDLRKAQQNLVLVDSLHLLYLITPYDIVSNVKPTGTVYYEVVLSLSTHQMQVAKLLGITEAVVEKLRMGITPKNIDTRVVQRFYVTLMLHELWKHESIFIVADKYQVNRGTIQNLLTSACSFASSVIRFSEELDEFWVFKDLLTTFGKKLVYCCASELEPLMQLPYVKIGRANQLYKAGYKSLQSIAKSKPDDIMEKIEHLPRKVVSQIISAAKLLLLEKVENLRDEVEEVLDGLDV